MIRQSRNRSAESLAIRTITIVSIAFTTSLLAGCGSEEQAAAPPPVEDTAFRDMAGAMDKARAVEGTIQAHKEALDRTLQDNENPTAE